mmetsp:Transcript_10313/g.18966  ORF Transcript_10313/g.18966 Transcript_10313/m.18966 type:complete len:783 (+) Transcript_10313:217-2565(+)
MRLQCKVTSSQHGALASACAFLPEGRELLTCADDQELKRLSVEDMGGETVAKLDGYPTDMAYCPSTNEKQASDTVALTFSDGSLRILQASSGKENKRLAAYTAGAAISVAWNPDGTAIATGGEDGVVKVWSRVGMLRNTVATMRQPVYCVCWGRNDSLLFSSGKTLSIEAKQQKQINWKAHDATILAVDWNIVNNLIVSGGEDCKYRVWDSYGRQLFTSAPLEHVVTCLAWNPKGSAFAAGAFDVLKICDRTGWTQSREDLTNAGSLLKLDWSVDGTLLGAACASGAVIIAEMANATLEWKHIRASMLDSKQIEVQDSLEDIQETLVFRDRIVDMSLEFGYLVVHTATPQVHVYSVSNLRTPTVVDVPASMTSVLIQSAKNFMAGWCVYTYEGRQVVNQHCLNGILTSVLDRDTIAMNDSFVSVVEVGQTAIRLIDLAKGKPVALIKHKLCITQIAMGEDDLLAFVDANGDLFVQVTGKRTFKLPCTMVESIRFNDTGALVAAVDGGSKLLVFLFPGIVWVDPDLLEETTMSIETMHLASKQPRIVSFTHNMVTIREQTGALVASGVSHYPALLHELINQRKWEDAIRLCRFVDQRYLWAVLAGKALDKCHLDSAEIGLASLQNVAKLNYILYIKDLSNEKARVAELALYKRDMKAAESVLLQANPPMLYRAIKINIRMHKWDRAKQIAQSTPQLARMVELYEKQWKTQEILHGKDLKELKAIKLKFSDKPPESEDEDEEADDGTDGNAEPGAGEEAKTEANDHSEPNDSAEGKANSEEEKS